MAAQAQADVESAKRQQAFFQQHLQELTLFKAKTSAALLQVRPSFAGIWRRAPAASCYKSHGQGISCALTSQWLSCVTLMCERWEAWSV